MTVMQVLMQVVVAAVAVVVTNEMMVVMKTKFPGMKITMISVK
jgi:hypothetical protein